MRLREAFVECDYQGLTPVLPFFPFPTANPEAAFEFLARLHEELPAGIVGLTHPALPGIEPGSKRAGDAAAEVPEWDLFQFVYALKHRTGAPVVLALRYEDVIRFGIIPWGQEGHKVGLDALLVRELLMEELDYFAAEMAAHGVGLAPWLHAGLEPGQVRALGGFATAFAYAETDAAVGILGESGNRVRVFHPASGAAPAAAATAAAERTGGWLLSAIPGLAGAATDWSALDPTAVAERIQAWSRVPPRRR